MWPIIFILALIPLFFSWSDSILGFFPQLSQYLPESKKKEPEKPALAAENNPEDPNYVPPPSSQWTVQNNEEGYVAWAMSLDGSYRLIIGCAPNSSPSLNLQTMVEKDGVLAVQTITEPKAVLHYHYGILATPNGQYDGPDLVEAVAQFGKMNFQHSNGEPTYARFQVDSLKSQSIARELTQECITAN